jgi:hypothetical protein
MKYYWKFFKYSNRPLKWFDDGVDVCRFIRNGNEKNEITINPWQCQINHFISLEVRDRIVD